MLNRPATRLLTPDEAAQALQPWMPGKDAAQWLRNDRAYDPLLPFVEKDGQVYYREEIVTAFAVKYLDAPITFARSGFYPTLERRRSSDRRASYERRMRPPLQLAKGIERRAAPMSDRRQDQTHERRHSAMG